MIGIYRTLFTNEPYKLRLLLEGVIIRKLLPNAANCVLNGGAYQSRRLTFGDVPFISEHADHDFVLVIDQQPDIIGNPRNEVAGFVRKLEAAYILWQSRAINLAAHDGEHFVARLFAYGLTVCDPF